MPVEFLVEAERERLSRFPDEIDPQDRVTFFTLSASDRERIPVQSAAHNRLGFALQLGAVRFMGFVPDPIASAPARLVQFVATQLGVAADGLEEYGARGQTRSDHLLEVLEYLGFRRAGPEDFEQLSAWLLERALEHDKPSLLFGLACERLRAERILRPGVTRLERIVAQVRDQARVETLQRLAPVLNEATRELLNGLLEKDPEIGGSRLSWLRTHAATHSPRSILQSLEKLRFLNAAGVSGWKLNGLNPNRLQFLAQIARRSSAQALERAGEEHRYPVLVAFLHQSLVDRTDDIVDLFDRCLAQSYARARNDLEEFRAAVAPSTNDKLLLFQQLARAVLDPCIGDGELRRVIFACIPPAALRSALEESDQIVRPRDDHYFDFLAQRYVQLRQFTPAFLAAFRFRSSRAPDPLLEAVEVLRVLNRTGRRLLPEGVPLDFVPPKWRPYVCESPRPADRRHYYELCALWELRGALRAGNVWLSRCESLEKEDPR